MIETPLFKMLFITVAALLSVFGQILLKLSISAIPDASSLGLWSLLITSLKHPLTHLGLGLYGISMVLFFKLLSVAELSYVGLGLSLGIIFLLLASRLFLGEALTASKLVGCLLIVAGVFVIHL